MITLRESKTVSSTFKKKFVRLFVLGVLISSSLVLPQVNSVEKVYAAGTINNWWPVDGRTMSGTQPFKALLEGRAVESYLMFWQVDNGQWNRMDSNYKDYPHKEVQVDLTNWKWRGVGPYNVNFIAIELDGRMIAQKNVTIYTGTPVQQTTVVVQPVSTQATTTTSPATTTQTVVKVTSSTSSTQTASTPVAPQITQMSGTFYVDPNSNAKREIARNPSLQPLLSKIADNPVARWFGGWNANIQSDVTNYVNAAEQANTIPVLVAYNIPGRDCGGYSSGGAGSRDAYRSWITGMANGIGSRKAIVILEPDALPLMNCLSDSGKQERFAMLRDAVNTLKSKPNVSVYLDAGHAKWVDANEIASRLNQAGISSANGFSLNVSNFETTSSNISYGEQVSSKVGGKHFVIDTSRNGRGSSGEWCNPWGRGLGNKPTSSTGHSLVDAFLWVKAPGESDGNCNGGPSAGTWWLDYALDLTRNASF